MSIVSFSKHALQQSLMLFTLVMLVACAAPQATQPTIAPLATQQATVASATAPAATNAPPTLQPSAIIVPTQPVAPSASAAPASAVPAARRLLLQEPRLQGDDVRALQQRLRTLGYWHVGTVDGIFGPQTDAGVRAFQHTNRLQVDGIVGPQTRARLWSATASAAVVPIVAHTSFPFLLGGVQAGVWLDAAAAAPLLLGGERYRLLTGQVAETAAIGRRPALSESPCTEFFTVDLEPAVGDAAAVAVGGDWPLLPRQSGEPAPSDRSLQQHVATFLEARGIRQPEVQIASATSIDLEGDGSDEVVVTATRLSSEDPTDAAAGDYSFVGVLKTNAGNATLIELVGNYFPQPGDFAAPYEYHTLAILDLNGDGGLEVVVDGAYYEGASTSAFQVEAPSARTLLTVDCGV